MTKGELIDAITTASGETLSKKQVKAVLESLQSLGHRQLKKDGMFTLPGFAKFLVVSKKAQAARKGVNPFTGDEMLFRAKPASKSVRARVIKACKDSIG
ncbi:MAG: HU family DNA-binding protein [Armatimonadetes bacterium]|nr:HU family DNA-binding protein [Armatimonadota bacterium]